jgi:putative Flp pilus-assembly TadE/G-like protein
VSLKRNQSGQTMVLTVLFITALVGMAALVLDAGSWFRAHRELQATADAAALAGAQEIPSDPAQANALANQYADKNTSGLTLKEVNFQARFTANDTIKVHLQKPAPGIFAKVFGINSVQEGASAAALATGMTAAKYVAPIAVNKQHPMLADIGCPCFGDETTIPLGKTGAPGAFDLLNLDGSRGGTSPGTLADWMLNGFDDYLPLGNYYSDPGAKFNSSQMQSALTERIGTVLMFPVYDTLTGNGANAQYHVIGWVGFYLDSFDARGSSGSITGHFTEVVWDGLPATTGGAGGPNFGARTVQLVE